MSRFGRSEPVGCLPAPRREPAFSDKGCTSPQAPKQRKPQKYSCCDQRSGALWKNQEPVGELFPMTPVLVETGQHKDQSYALPAGRHGRSRKRQAAICGRCMVVGWLHLTRSCFRPQQTAAHAMGSPPRCSHAPRRSDPIAPYLLKPYVGFPSSPRGHCGSPCVDSLSSS